MDAKNLQLGVSTTMVVIMGMSYGMAPETALTKLVGMEVHNVELLNVFRSLMGLYLAFGLLFLIGIRNHKYWVTSTLMSVFFFGGLAMGRVVSDLLDGVSTVFTMVLVTELILAFWGIGNLIRYNGA